MSAENVINAFLIARHVDVLKHEQTWTNLDFDHLIKKGPIP